MYLVTNRHIRQGKTGYAQFGSVTSTGAVDLRIFEIDGDSDTPSITLLPDRLTKAEVKSINDGHQLGLDLKKTWHSSLKVAVDLMTRARQQSRHILMYVHGYNNDVHDVVRAATELEHRYDVLVLAFSWPANGGGLYGKASYLSDKEDARVSVGAFNRVIEKMQMYLDLLTARTSARLWEKSQAAFPNNPLASQEHFSQLQAAQCQVSVNLLCHSMGNYLLKYALFPKSGQARRLTFDNVCLVAADANNQKHSEWLGLLEARHRIYVVINENDMALKWSRRKPGREQLARLGHYLRKLNTPSAHYIDVTNAPHIGDEHTYFKGESIANNADLRQLFADMFTGKAAEHRLTYHADLNAYRF